ncbi:hypothetical protein ACK8OR_09110 [Jannaschia sp. KMU-145]|uniref:hypothetical protein n=1 Tax=Jannaschia halovivens TaxID=3388667 RepID=UPI00396B19C0
MALAIAGLLIAAPVTAAPNAQLVQSVQTRLNTLGFGAVDAGSLTTRQIAALHMQLQGGTMEFGIPQMDARQKVRVILGWDGYTLRD